MAWISLRSILDGQREHIVVLLLQQRGIGLRSDLNLYRSQIQVGSEQQRRGGDDRLADPTEEEDLPAIRRTCANGLPLTSIAI